jgi:3-hydroxy-9,10-secoandrosta-1,3,5(10)-triene-9,17-dione monooxygenase
MAISPKNLDAPSDLAEVVARARKLEPGIAERAQIAEAGRRVPEESIEELIGSGLTRLYTPRRWGGLADGFGPGVQAVIEVARGCTSTGWCFGFLNLHSWLLGMFPEQAQADVWAEDPDATLAASFAPAGKAEPVEGGYRLSGDWPWASGIDHCGWIIVGGLVLRKDAEPAIRLHLVPRSDFEVRDTWFNVGLRGSGSNNAAISEAFVPEHRTMAIELFRDGTGPGAEVNEEPMYATPMMMAFMSGLCAPAVGAAIGAYEDYREWTREKTATFGGHDVAGSADIQRRLTAAGADIEAARTVLEAAVARADEGPPFTLLDRARNRRDWAWVIAATMRGVDALMQAGGARVLFETNKVQRVWRDVHAISCHLGLNPDTAGVNFGRLELGLEPDPADKFH